MRTLLVRAKSYAEAKKQMPWAKIIIETLQGSWRGFDSAESFEQWQEKN